ncbi:phosphoesterase, partial [Gorgonomyces haynaldii]
MLTSVLAAPVQHVVHIMFENRSFDSIFGYLDHNPEIDNLLNKQVCNYRNALQKTGQVCARKLTHQEALYSPYGPDHSFQSAQEQIYGTLAKLTKEQLQKPAPMNGFVQNALNQKTFPSDRVDQVMAAFDPKDIPIFTTLAQEFTVCDRWFSGAPGSTQPNRAIAESGTANGQIHSNADTIVGGFTQKSIIDSFIEQNKTWVNYYLEVPTLVQFTTTREFLIPDETAKNLSTDFYRDVMAGNLPQYTLIDPYYVKNDGAAPGLFGRAEELLKFVYETLRQSPVWESTLLLVTFDEHGGFHDHVPPPANVPSPDGILGPAEYPFDFKRLGVRVPVLFVSPWVQKGGVIHGPTNKPYPDSVFEHASIPATLESLFGLTGTLTNRTKWAGKFDDIFLSQMRTDTPLVLPQVVLPTV